MLRRRSVCRAGARLRQTSLLDRVYEHITLPPIIVAAIDTAPVQRLRELKQLGIVDYLYPGATHTRFEHSIGVAHLARVWLEQLAARQPELGVTQRDIELVMLAGLCHDLGHGPLSHLFEDAIIGRIRSNPLVAAGAGKSGASAAAVVFRHEDMSKKLVRRVAAAPGVELSATEVDVVAQLIDGDYAADAAAVAPQKLFLREIVANKRSGIDVDKIDYFLRDATCCFGRSVSDVRPNRLFGSCRVAPLRLADGRTEMVLAYEDKMAGTLRDICAIRAKLHKSVYQHQVTKRVGHMVADALALAAPFFTVHESATLVEAIQDPELFLHTGDWILDAILHSGGPNLAPARDLLGRLRRRDLYRTVLLRQVHPDAAVTEADVTAGVTAELRRGQHAAGADVEAVVASMIVEVFSIHHGKKAKDPLTFVPFYNPKEQASPNESPRVRFLNMGTEAGVAPRIADISTPTVFEEKMCVVLSRSAAHAAALRSACAAWASGEGRQAFAEGHLFAFNAPPHA